MITKRTVLSRRTITEIIVADCSFWQNAVNFTTMSKYLNGVILRAGQATWQDIRFQEFRRAVKPIMPFGNYWYYSNHVAPKRQAEKWAEILANDYGQLGCWVDLEDGTTGDFGTASHWYDFIEYFKLFCPTAKVGIYTRAQYFNSRVARTNKYFSQFPLWIAQYKTVKPDMPHGWTDYLFWQFTPEGDGTIMGVGSKEIDLNYFNGDLPAFRARFNLGNTPSDDGTTQTLLATLNSGEQIRFEKRG